MCVVVHSSFSLVSIIIILYELKSSVVGGRGVAVVSRKTVNSVNCLTFRKV